MKQLLIWIFIFTLASLACGMPVNTQPEPKISIKVQTPIPEPAPTPERAILGQMTVCKTDDLYGLWVRKTAGIHGDITGWLKNGNTVTLTSVPPVTLDKKAGGGTWVQIISYRDTGWVNVRYLCGGNDE